MLDANLEEPVTNCDNIDATFTEGSLPERREADQVVVEIERLARGELPLVPPVLAHAYGLDLLEGGSGDFVQRLADLFLLGALRFPLALSSCHRHHQISSR